jgi:hypothetical protein
VLSAAEGHAALRAMPLHGALGLVLRAPDPLPPFRASIKVRSHGLPFLRSFASRTATDENRRPPFPFQDGYAIVASDGPGEYPVVTESRAGDDALGVIIAPGTVAYVTTGGQAAWRLLSSAALSLCMSYCPGQLNDRLWLLAQGRFPMARTPSCRWRTPSRSPADRMGSGG